MNWDFLYRGESACLDETSRRVLEGSFVELSHGYTHYEIAGPEDGAAVVLVHGFSAAFFVWDPTFTALRQAGKRVLRYDLFGRGFSDRPHLPYNLDLFVGQLTELLDSLSLRRVDLVGLSMGGPVSTAFAAKTPNRVRRIVLIDPVGAEPVPLRFVYRLAVLPGVGELVLGLGGTGRLLSSAAADIFGGSPVQEFRESYLQQMRFKGFKRSLLSSVRNGMVDGFPSLYEQVGKLQIPVLLVWGSQDRAVPVRQSRAILDRIPQASLHVIDGCGHTPHYEKPEVVNPILLEFLAKP